jgi:uncharacterized protein (DUF2267 family)
VDLRVFYQRVAAQLPESLGREIAPGALTHAVLCALAECLRPTQARALAARLPRPLRELLRTAKGPGRLDRDPFIENIASRLDLDDDTAELGAVAVLATLRQCLEPNHSVSQLLETLPADLQRFMSP